MKKRALALSLALSLALTGCASMLDRSYEVSTPHVDRPVTGEDPSVLQVKNYRELVQAVLYLVSRGEETGTIQMPDYNGDVEADLTAACLEVATEDPLGAYCVDYIKHETARVVGSDQAELTIRYRRSREQVNSMVKVTGTSAIRTELREALSLFQREVVLRVAYFAGDADSIAGLIRQSYYDNPAWALGFPGVEIALYPDSGRERVVEILLTYAEEPGALQKKGEQLSAAVEELAEELEGLSGRDVLKEAARLLRERAVYDPTGESTPLAAFTGQPCDDEGLSLALVLLCRNAGVTAQVVEGTVPGGEGREERFWVMISPEGGNWYLDPAGEGGEPLLAEELAAAGYDWPAAPRPAAVMEQTVAPAGENSPEKTQ